MICGHKTVNTVSHVVNPNENDFFGMPVGERMIITVSQFRPQHFLYFLPLPQGQGWLRPTLGEARTKVALTNS